MINTQTQFNHFQNTMGMLQTQLKRARKFFRQKLCFNSSILVMPDSWLTFLCAVTLAPPIIFPVSSMSDHPMPPPSTSPLAILSFTENPAEMTAPSPASAPLQKRSSVDQGRVHPASIEEDYFGYWNPEPFEGIEGPGPIPHVDGYSHHTELE